VRLEMPCNELRVSLLQTLSTPHVLAAEYLFGRETAYPYTAIAQGGCGILQLRKSDYIKMVGSDKVFLFNILNYLSSGSQTASRHPCPYATAQWPSALPCLSIRSWSMALPT
ncbi:MAG: hypothetical protein IJ879_04400, partial [Muribaculaceae bacterium]|nr:hypothetical protein [Muribaculaceae bacterium]